MRIRFLFMFLVCFFAGGQAVSAATYTVNSPENTDDGSCVAPYVNSSNDCTLHEAIDAANGNPGTDSIVFSIDSSFDGNPTYTDGTQYVIPISSVLPSITGQTILSAAANYDSGNDIPGIKLTSASTSFDALTFASGSSSSRVSGIEVDGFRRAIYASVGSSLTIGTDCDGITDASERNVFYGGANNAIRIDTASNIVAGNYLGVQNDGETTDATGFSTLTLNTANADDNFVGFREGQTCTAEQQRNIIAGTTSFATALSLNGAGTANASGDASLAPDGNTIAGNYIGVAADGTTGIPGSGTGGSVNMSANTTLNIIGTDGDGVDDGSEGNVIYGNGVAILISGTGTNRVSGNFIGVDSTGNTVIGSAITQGLILTGDDNIIGWCNASVNATLCSNSGTASTQRNVFGGATSHGMRFGSTSSDNVVYGNYFGVGANGTADVGNADVGIFIHRNSDGNVAGGSGDKANIISFNGIGVLFDGDFTGSEGTIQTPITDTTVSGNTISQNDASGVQFYYTLNYSSTDNGNVLSNNTIEENGTYGVDVFGSSPTISGNTIQDNASYGVFIRPGFVTYDENTEIEVSADPDTADEDLVSAPTVSGNTFSSNVSGGILQRDTTAANDGALYSANTFNSANTTPAVTQQWYAVVEVLDRRGDALSNTYLPSTTVTMTPQGSVGSALTSAATDTEGDDNIFGPASIDYRDATTWFTVTEYTVSTTGATTTYNDYTIDVDGTYSTDSGEWSIDGTDNDDTFAGTLANSITSGGHERYQIVHVDTSTTPATPTNTSPSTAATVSTLTPSLQTSAFSDVDDIHASSTWNIFPTSALCAAGGTGSVYSTTSSSSFTSLTVPSGKLSQSTTYYWNARHTNSFGNSSSNSSCTSFTTIRTTPSATNTIPDQEWNEDESLVSSIDLDEYFSDAEGETLSFSATASDENITVTIAAGNILEFSSTENWNGEATVTVTACDTDAECIDANAFAVVVQSVNDIPVAPAGGFSPTQGDVIQASRPTFSWNAGTDEEDDASSLFYDVRVGTSAQLTNARIEQSGAGKLSLTWSEDLSDDTTYYYAVRTVDSEGARSPWSVTQQFKVNSSTAPRISLTKEYAILSSELGANVLARSLTSSTGRSIGAIQNISTIGLGVSVSVLLVSIFSAVLIFGKPLAAWWVMTMRPAQAFVSTPALKNGTYTQSYSTFRRRIFSMGALMQGSVFAAVIFVGVLMVSTISFGEDSLDQLAPGDTILVTVEYANTGDGSATNASLVDTLSHDTHISTESISAVHNTSARTTTQDAVSVAVDIGSIAPGTSGRLQYTLALANPVSANTVTLPAAVLTADQFQGGSQIESDWLTMNVRTAAVQITVVNEENQPVSGVPIVVSEQGAQRAIIASNTNGTALFSGLNAGVYTAAIKSGSAWSSDPITLRLSYDQTQQATLLLVAQKEEGDSENSNQPVDEVNETPVNEEEPNEAVPPTLVDDADISEEVQEAIEGQLPLTDPVTTFTPEESQQLQQDLEAAVQAIIEQISLEVNGVVDSRHNLEEQNITIRRPKNCSLLHRFMFWKNEDVQDDSALVFEGDIQIDEVIRQKLQEADAPIRLRITILSDPLVQVTQIEESGEWRIEFPLELFTNESHNVFAEASANGQSSGVVEVTKFSLEDSSCTSYTLLVLLGDILGILLVMILWASIRRRWQKNNSV